MTATAHLLTRLPKFACLPPCLLLPAFAYLPVCLLLPASAYLPACLLLPTGPLHGQLHPPPIPPSQPTRCCLQAQRSRPRFPACLLLPAHQLLPATACRSSVRGPASRPRPCAPSRSPSPRSPSLFHPAPHTASSTGRTFTAHGTHPSPSSTRFWRSRRSRGSRGRWRSLTRTPLP